MMVSVDLYSIDSSSLSIVSTFGSEWRCEPKDLVHDAIVVILSNFVS